MVHMRLHGRVKVPGTVVHDLSVRLAGVRHSQWACVLGLGRHWLLSGRVDGVDASRVVDVATWATSSVDYHTAGSQATGPAC